MVIATAARSTVTGWLMLVVVPAVLVPETAILTVPAGQFVTSAAGTPTLRAIGEYRCAVGDAIDNHRQRRPAASPLPLPVITNA